jgi:hypothetical protein
MPLIIPSMKSGGVEEVLAEMTLPLSTWYPIMSVNVPPTSIATI